MSSHAERYAEFRRQQADSSAAVEEFRRLYDFEFDAFQVRACRALEEGQGVLVAAPTGSGKTVVGEFAVHLALSEGRKCFYTTPIKALSNQKYADLARRYGADRVGLLTGDNSVNGEAPVVVMTTEVLRNMLYAGSATLAGLAFVVMDEVHYLADRFRGAVWEEVIIHLPESVRMVALSATVSNAEEFGEWLQEVRGETRVIVDEHRPVPLWQHMLVGNRMHDLFVSPEDADEDEYAEQAARGVSAARRAERRAARAQEKRPEQLVNPRLLRLARDDARYTQLNRKRRSARGRTPYKRPQTRFRPPGRPEIVERLDAAALLPAIVFIFSRAGCEAAVADCLAAGLRLTTVAEREEIRAFVERRCAELPPADLAVLGYDAWLAGLERGVASHHAGLLPTFKEVVEELFSRSLVKAVFATETLALGINMPARTVVIEKMDKWNGETHADLTAGEYTQLTGRAGRRGIDVEGHAVVVWQPGVDPEQVAGLASTRTYPLNSSFRPSYNMAVNLVGQVGRERSRTMLEASFAQFQSDRAVVGLVRELRRNEAALEGYARAAECHLGDFMAYARLRRQLSDLEKNASRVNTLARRDQAARSLERLRPGDVIRVPAGRRAGFAVVLDPGVAVGNGDGPSPLVLTVNRQVKRLTTADFPVPVEPVERLRIPKTFQARSARSRQDLASMLRAKLERADAPPPVRVRDVGEDDEIARLRRELRAHPCHGCAEREDHARWAERYFRLERDVRSQRQRVEGRSHVIARTFDRVCGVLDDLGYLEGDDVTPQGRRLAKIYSELDLLAAESLRTGVWDGLSPEELAAVVSGLVFETRRPDDAHAPRIPPGAAADAVLEMARLWGELYEVEKNHRVSFLREPDFGFAWAAFRWARGHRLDAVLSDTELTAGDFVRAVRQLLDLLGQVADAAPEEGGVRRTARAAMDALRRGVVAYSSVS
ncbi:DEAD/DEAH box helicase [Allonocardiopsis opalescens]|uniref:Probable helicase HelY n=1 Tax=Allonocardiopsis opalescens TaxID=1144618 RepID=A0A2T0PUD1_9ACTN|nr:DEAD/DEAH box helicase [Allonocardiopsis opalescens]PRX92336.1 ATP-dependent RNA helicase HelY [Allonocardiopsis opalescens]